ncbi:MAG: hypothetical protein EOO62_40275, partial [Hymenobacter sp.]
MLPVFYSLKNAALKPRQLSARPWLIGLLLTGAAQQASAQYIISSQTDKARYAPSQAVTFSIAIDSPQPGLTLAVKYYQAGTLVSQQTVPATAAAVSWAWTPPTA